MGTFKWDGAALAGVPPIPDAQDDDDSSEHHEMDAQRAFVAP